MGRSIRVWRLAAMLVGVVVAAAGAQPARAALPAADNASDIEYDPDWYGLSNGGHGFGPWSIRLNGGIVRIGSSTANGDSAPPAGDIDSAGGKSWAISSGQSAGSPRAVRPFVGALDVGQHVSFDVDANPNTANADQLLVILGNANETRWSLLVFSGGTRMWDGQSPGSMALVGGYPVEGVHVDFLLTGPDSFTATVHGLDGSNPVSISAGLAGAASSLIDQIAFDVGPGLGRVDAFYLNNLAVTPEPGVGAMVVGAGIVLVRRKRR